jgi:hypothetical protein
MFLHLLVKINYKEIFNFITLEIKSGNLKADSMLRSKIKNKNMKRKNKSESKSETKVYLPASILYRDIIPK